MRTNEYILCQSMRSHQLLEINKILGYLQRIHLLVRTVLHTMRGTMRCTEEAKGRNAPPDTEHTRLESETTIKRLRQLHVSWKR